MNLKGWYNRDLAELWPAGSVVLTRIRKTTTCSCEYNYILSLCFSPETISFDKGIEYMLVEVPKEK